MIKEYRLSAVTASIIMLAVGLLLLIKPETSLNILCAAIAAALFIIAATRLLRYIKLRRTSSSAAGGNLTAAVVLVILSLWLLLKPSAIASIIPALLGIIVILDGIGLVIIGISYTAYLPNRGLVTFLFGAAAIILGIFAIRHGFEIQLVLMKFLGAAMTATALFNLVNHIMVERADAKRENATTVKFEEIKHDDRE